MMMSYSKFCVQDIKALCLEEEDEMSPTIEEVQETPNMSASILDFQEIDLAAPLRYSVEPEGKYKRVTTKKTNQRPTTTLLETQRSQQSSVLRRPFVARRGSKFKVKSSCSYLSRTDNHDIYSSRDPSRLQMSQGPDNKFSLAMHKLKPKVGEKKLSRNVHFLDLKQDKVKAPPMTSRPHTSTSLSSSFTGTKRSQLISSFLRKSIEA